MSDKEWEEYVKKLRDYEEREYYTLGEAAKLWAKESKRAESDALGSLCSIIARDKVNIQKDGAYGESIKDLLSKERTFKESIELIHPDNSRLLNVEQNETPENIEIHRNHLRDIFERQGVTIPEFLNKPTLPEIESKVSNADNGQEAKVEQAAWEDVTWTFLSNELVSIEVKGVPKKYLYSDLGFADKRKGDEPNSRWAILKRFAENNGEITWSVKISEKEKNRMSAAVRDIRKILKEFFGINDDPFHPYRGIKSYKTKFTIKDNRHITEDSKPKGFSEEEIINEELSDFR